MHPLPGDAVGGRPRLRRPAGRQRGTGAPPLLADAAVAGAPHGCDCHCRRLARREAGAGSAASVRGGTGCAVEGDGEQAGHAARFPARGRTARDARSARTTASESSKLRREQRVESKTADSGARQNAGAAANLRDEVRRDVAMPPAGPPTDARAVGAMPPPSPPAAPPPSAARAPGAPAAAPTSAAAKPAEESQLARFAAERAEQSADTALGAVIATPDPNVQWRVLAGTSVQRSIDRGRTWAAQDTGATGALLAGAAPSAAVCWIVGARGAVFLTTDGRTWTRVPFPHEIDLIRVAAESASSRA